MKKKYIIDLNPDCVEGEYLRIPARIAGEEQWLVTKAALTPYTEPDLEQVREEAYEQGYKDMLNEVNKEVRKSAEEIHAEITEDAYKRGYDTGFTDAKCGYENGFENGMIVAWEAARKIWKYDTTTLRAIFGEGIIRMDLFMNLTAAEAIEKLKAYEQERDAIKVGDEVVSENDIKAVVIDMDDYLLHVLDENGVVNGWPREDVAKTDRHFPEIATILEKMRGEQDG